MTKKKPLPKSISNKAAKETKKSKPSAKPKPTKTTAKKTASKTSVAKQSQAKKVSVTKRKAPSTRGKTAASPVSKAVGKKVSKVPAKKIVSKTSSGKGSKTASAKVNKTRTSNPPKLAKSKVESAEGEKRVREIVSKNLSLKEEEKVESRGFSLNDVRQILKTKTDKKEKLSNTGKKKVVSPKTDTKAPPAPKKKSTKVKKLQTASVDDILGFGVSLGPTRPIRDESKVPNAWKTFYKDLMSLRASLKGALGERSSETIGASAREASGELSLNSSDAGTETFDRDVALSMVASEQEALEEVEDAIDRIFDGSYGICQETKKPIKKTRLKVVPFTRFSLEGQNQFEQRKTKEQDSGSGAFATISDSTMGVEE